jgi:hypothetical protein
MTTFALEFLRIDGRLHLPTYSTIPANSTPADELNAFLVTMHENVGAPIAQMSPGRFAVHLTEAQQIWSVRIVSVGDAGDTEELETGDLAQ